METGIIYCEVRNEFLYITSRLREIPEHTWKSMYSTRHLHVLKNKATAPVETAAGVRALGRRSAGISRVQPARAIKVYWALP